MQPGDGNRRGRLPGGSGIEAEPRRMPRSSLGECDGGNVFEEEEIMCAKAKS